ncbi:YjjG family noncanonical pyrimidine nucleotidase [Halosquirtibacter xylanolyticus]|uniref:YjjG family noncanonical pyrimidine nucleotidase n=1 Tax=Halosquirtibacter xylanolyticus TaxID=3374599 RepID=UPI00374A37E9|nr:YjjG family noncanonical pyrimidine nucleotidase [Prolixibacteraceae bacterium]
MFKKSSNTKTLLIDLDHTLWDFDANSKVALKEAMDHMNILDWVDNYDLFFAEYEKINTEYWVRYRKKEIDKEKLIIGRFEDTFAKVLPKAKGLGLRLNECYLEYMPLQSKLMPGAWEFLEYASGKYRIVLITNGFRVVQRKKLYTSKIDQFVDHVVTSEEVGSPKPSPKIFQHALSCANTRKADAIMIGDSLEADVKGALAMGIPTIYFTDDKLSGSEIKESNNLLSITNDWYWIKEQL